MFVRAWDKESGTYYKSMVYGLINTGYYEQAILFHPNRNTFELIDYFDKGTVNGEQQNFLPVPLYEWINQERVNWVTYKETDLYPLKQYGREYAFEVGITLYQGYQEIFENFELMWKLLCKKRVSFQEAGICLRTNEDAGEWTYIRTQNDADELMKLFAGFHDATLDKLVYEEDYEKKQLNVIFDNSGWYGVIELCFEGLIRMNLVGFPENYSREIYEAVLLIQDESVFWADSFLEKESMDYQGTWIKALNVKWKKKK